jgi:hypothetical protein
MSSARRRTRDGEHGRHSKVVEALVPICNYITAQKTVHKE